MVEYTEFGSKNRPGGRRQLNFTNKIILHYFVCPRVGECCHVHVLKDYLSKLPKCAFERDIFYWKQCSKQNISKTNAWYKATPLGYNMLDTKLKAILQLGGLKTENRSSQSLRASAITRMQEKKLPENVIMEQSGHLLKEGVRSYEETSEFQKKEVSEILSDITHSSTVNSATVTAVDVSRQMPWDADS